MENIRQVRFVLVTVVFIKNKIEDRIAELAKNVGKPENN